MWLFKTQRFGIKLGLGNSRRLFNALGVPQPNERIIHVAGTNGKGSVCALLDSICRAAGYRTALFTSPHLVSFRERIQVNGELISEGEVVRGLTKIRELVAGWEPHPTFFEITTGLALDHFRNLETEIVVLETGMGGRLDATNATQPVVSVLTPTDYDHQKWLGSSLTEIAREKAGIIKPGVPVVSARQLPEVEAVIRARAAECAAPLDFVARQLCVVPAVAQLLGHLPGRFPRAELELGRRDLKSTLADEVSLDLVFAQEPLDLADRVIGGLRHEEAVVRAADFE